MQYHLNLYGSLDGKPNRGPGGIPSLEGDFGSPTGQAGGKGGNPGQWSARKAQMLAKAYKKAGGGYRG